MEYVKKGTVYNFSGKFHSTISRAGVPYLGIEMEGGVVIVCKDDESQFTIKLLEGMKSKEKTVVQVTSDDAYLEKNKLFGRISVVSKASADRRKEKLKLTPARNIMRKLVVEYLVNAREGSTSFRVIEGKVFVNNKGKGKALSEVTLSWIESKL